MTDFQISTISPPLNQPAVVDSSLRLVRKAAALGLLGDADVNTLDLELLRRIARAASAAGIGQNAAAALLHRDSYSTDLLVSLIDRLDSSLAESPLPDREVRELLRVLDREQVGSLAGTTAVSLGRYMGGTRAWPDDVASRLHWLALVVGDLHGAYNEYGIRRWFDRERMQLNGRSPRQVLRPGWDPEEPDVIRVRELAAVLSEPGAGT